MQPAPELRSAAEAIVASLAADGEDAAWNGVHLPLERHARDMRVSGDDEARSAKPGETTSTLQAPSELVMHMCSTVDGCLRSGSVR